MIAVDNLQELMTTGTLQELMTKCNLQIPSLMSVTEEESRKATYLCILHYFRNKVE